MRFLNRLILILCALGAVTQPTFASDIAHIKPSYKEENIELRKQQVGLEIQENIDKAKAKEDLYNKKYYWKIKKEQLKEGFENAKENTKKAGKKVVETAGMIIMIPVVSVVFTLMLLSGHG